MRERIHPRIRTLLDQKKIHRAKATIEILAKELDEARRDLESAQVSLKNGNYKWTMIQAHHSMFHAARALLYRMGYREQSHQGLLAALNQLYDREIVDEMLEDFSKATTITEKLHDGLSSSEKPAKGILENATDFLEQAARVLAAPREWFERPAPRRHRVKTRKR